MGSGRWLIGASAENESYDRHRLLRANVLAGGAFLRAASRERSLLSQRALLVGLRPSARGAGVRAPVARQPDLVGQLPAAERIGAQRAGRRTARSDPAGRLRLRRPHPAAVRAPRS